jgi:hypothetical protein
VTSDNAPVAFTPPAYTPPQPSPRPTRLTIVMVFLWVIEGLVLLGAAWGLLMNAIQLVAGPLNTLPAGHPGADHIEKMFWASLPVAQLPVGLVQVLVSVALLYLAIQAFRGRPREADQLRTALVVATGFAVLKFVFTAYVQYTVMNLMTAYMDTLMSAGPSTPPPGMSEVMGAATTVGAIVGIAFSVAVVGAKLFLYLYARAILGAEDVRAFLNQTPQRPLRYRPRSESGHGRSAARARRRRHSYGSS